MHTSKRLNFYSQIKNGVSIFDSLDYSIITGGFVQNEDKLGDVDIISVIPYVTGYTQEKALLFIKEHVMAQLNNGFKPDYLFPSDVVSRQQIVDAVNGRALEVKNGELQLKEFSEDEMENNPEADYRVWLYEMITHDFDMIKGNFDLLSEDTVRALKTVWTYTAHKCSYKNSVPIDKVRSDLFDSAGLSYKLNEKQCRHLVIMLEKYKMGVVNGDGVLLLDDTRVSEETERLKGKVSKGFNANHFLKWKDARKSISKLELGG